MSKRLGGIKGCKYKNLFMAFSYIITIIILGSHNFGLSSEAPIRSTSTLQCIYHLCSFPFVVYKTVNDKLHTTGMAAQSSDDSPLYCTLNKYLSRFVFHPPAFPARKMLRFVLLLEIACVGYVPQECDMHSPRPRRLFVHILRSNLDITMSSRETKIIDAVHEM